MNRWVALLRGVNVNSITIRNAELAQLFRELGFEAVRTVLASGNVCFMAHGSELTPTHLKARIERGLSERFNYDAWIVLVSEDALTDIVAAYPFPQDDQHHAYVVFASDQVVRAELLADPSADLSGTIEQVSGGIDVVYWRCPKGSSTDTAFSKHTAKARFKATTTTRNLNTLRKLLPAS